MGVVSDFASRKMLQSLFMPDVHTYLASYDGSAWSGSVWIALTKTPPIIGTASGSLTEPVAASYTRKSYGIGSDYWQIVNHSSVSNKNTIYFSAPAEDWGIISGWALCTSASGGDVIAHGPLNPVKIVKGAIVNIHAGGIVISVVS